MGARDWYQSPEWNEETEADFRKRLGRARASNRTQYLRAKVSALVAGHPQIALQLLREYFASGGDFLRAFAYGMRAQAMLGTGDVEGALAAYVECLDYEAAHPGVNSNAYLEFPVLVARLRRRDHYERVLRLFSRWGEEVFEIQRFTQFAVMAVIHDDLGSGEEARMAAVAAMEAAGVQHSGMRYHPRVGLVGELPEELRVTLERLVGPGSA